MFNKELVKLYYIQKVKSSATVKTTLYIYDYNLLFSAKSKLQDSDFLYAIVTFVYTIAYTIKTSGRLF